MEDIEQYIIRAVKSLRKKKNVSQKQLAIILNVSTSFVGNIENERNPAKYNLRHLNRLIDYFNTCPCYFFGRTPASFPEDSNA